MDVTLATKKKSFLLETFSVLACLCGVVTFLKSNACVRVCVVCFGRVARRSMATRPLDLDSAIEKISYSLKGKNRKIKEANFHIKLSVGQFGTFLSRIPSCISSPAPLAMTSSDKLDVSSGALLRPDVGPQSADQVEWASDCIVCLQ